MTQLWGWQCGAIIWTMGGWWVERWVYEAAEESDIIGDKNVLF